MTFPAVVSLAILEQETEPAAATVLGMVVTDVFLP
jgi:hypothetical protein